MKTSELLTRTAETLRRRGHIKFMLEAYRDGGEGPVCLMGAMNLALRGNSRYPESYPENYERAVKHLLTVTEAPAMDRGPISTMVHWNNETERTPAEVIQAVEAAAAAALAEGD